MPGNSFIQNLIAKAVTEMRRVKSTNKALENNKKLNNEI